MYAKAQKQLFSLKLIFLASVAKRLPLLVPSPRISLARRDNLRCRSSPPCVALEAVVRSQSDVAGRKILCLCD